MLPKFVVRMQPKTADKLATCYRARREGGGKGREDSRLRIENRTQNNKQITPRSLGCCRQKSSAAQHREKCEGEREERRKSGRGAGTINYRVIRVECGSRKVV